MQQRTSPHSPAIALSCLPGAGRSCSSSSSRAMTRCRPSAGSSMTSTRSCRSCRSPRATSPRRSTRARGARARAHHGRSRQWGVVLSVVLLDVVLLQCGSQGLSSKSIVSSLTFNHILHDKTRLTTAQTPLISISTSPSMAPATRIRSRTIDDTVKVRAAAHATAATHPRSPDSASLAQRANEDLGQHEQLPASSDEAQM